MSFGAAIQALIGADVSGVQSGAGQVESLSAKMNSALGQIGVGLSFGAVTAFFARVTERAGAVQDLADRLGVGSDALQAFEYRAEQAGAGADQAAAMWDKARKSVSQLVAGQKEAVTAFATLGLHQKDLIGIPLEQQVEKIAKAYSAAKGTAGAYDAVTDILGSKTAPRLMAVISQLANDGLPAFTESAREAGQVIGEETIAKLDELGDNMATLKGASTTAGAFVLDKFVKLGEGLGYFAADVVNLFDGVSTSWDVAGQKAAKSGEEQVAAVAKVMAKAEVLKRMDAEQFDRTTALLPVKQRINALELQAIELRRQAANAGKGTAEWAEKEERARKLFAEAEKLVTEEKRKQNLTSEEQMELSRLQGKLIAGTITVAEKARLEILNLQTKQLTIQAELAPLIEKGYKNLSPEEKKRFDQLVKQTDEITKQIGQKTKIIEATKNQVGAEAEVGAEIVSNTAKWREFIGVITSSGRGDKSLDDRELARKIRNIKNDIFQRQVSSPFQEDFLLNPQRYNLQQAEAELRFRGDVRRANAAFGPDRAFQMFDGLDARRFKEIIQGGLPDQEKLNRTLENLDRSVQGLNENLKIRPKI